MRIISEAKDYYDCIQASGMDHGLLYVRSPKKVKFENGWPFPSFLGTYGRSPLYVRQHIVGFCGKIYPVLQMMRCEKTHLCALHAQLLVVPGKTFDGLTTCYDLEEVDTFMAKVLNEDEAEAYRSKKWTRNSAWPWGLRRIEFAKYFEQCEKYKESPTYTKYFETHRCPVFVATQHNGAKEEPRFVVNGLLRELEFMRKFDPFQAYQEIAMFLGNMAMPEKPIPEIDDEIMSEIKGFNEWSFRKPPSKKTA